MQLPASTGTLLSRLVGRRAGSGGRSLNPAARFGGQMSRFSF